jgi:hypothetical protein
MKKRKQNEPIDVRKYVRYNAVGDGVMNAIQETLYLNSIPNMAESIMEAEKEPLEECPVYNQDEEQ